jgi:hypothetical protein
MIKGESAGQEVVIQQQDAVHLQQEQMKDRCVLKLRMLNQMLMWCPAYQNDQKGKTPRFN